MTLSIAILLVIADEDVPNAWWRITEWSVVDRSGGEKPPFSPQRSLTMLCARSGQTLWFKPCG